MAKALTTVDVTFFYAPGKRRKKITFRVTVDFDDIPDFLEMLDEIECGEEFQGYEIRDEHGNHIGN